MKNVQRYRADIGGGSGTQWPIVVPDDKGQLVLHRDYAKLEAVVTAARNIQHWHDTLKGEGMVVSSNAVWELWKALATLDAG